MVWLKRHTIRKTLELEDPDSFGARRSRVFSKKARLSELKISVPLSDTSLPWRPDWRRLPLHAIRNFQLKNSYPCLTGTQPRSITSKRVKATTMVGSRARFIILNIMMKHSMSSSRIWQKQLEKKNQNSY